MFLNTPTQSQAKIRSWGSLLVFLILVALWRHEIGANLPLSVDEAYYIAWSKSIDWGYWTKPPMIAWAIGAARFLCGETAGCVRFTSLLAFPLTAITLVWLSCRMGATLGAACVLGALFATLPLSSFYGIAATTDAFLLFFWACAMLSLWLALEGKFWAWPALGVSFGMGMLSKYTMVVFGLSAVLILLHPKWRFAWRTSGPYLAAMVSLLVFLPNIYWNLKHEMPTFQHTADISQGGNAYGLHWEVLGKFLSEQFLIGNPLLVIGAVLVLIGQIKKPNHLSWFALSCCLPILFVISTQALLSRAHANWAAPAYLGVCMAAVFHYWPARKTILVAAFIFNGMFATILYHYQSLIAQPFQLSGTIAADPFWALRPWPEITKTIEQELESHQPDRDAWQIASEDRAILAQAQAALKLPAGHAMGWLYGSQPHNHFDQHFPLPLNSLRPVLLVTRLPDQEVLIKFPNAIKQSELKVSTPTEKMSYQLWWLGSKLQK